MRAVHAVTTYDVQTRVNLAQWAIDRFYWTRETIVHDNSWLPHSVPYIMSQYSGQKYTYIVEVMAQLEFSPRYL